MTDALKALEERVAAIEARLADHEPPLPEDTFWVLEGLESRSDSPSAVVFAGSVDVPDAGPVKWQQGLSLEALQDRDWATSAQILDALANPVRLTLLKLIFDGTRTTSELSQQENLGTTGQLHHHLRALMAGGWLHSSARGHYAIPPERIVPLLIILTATST